MTEQVFRAKQIGRIFGFLKCNLYRPIVVVVGVGGVLQDFPYEFVQRRLPKVGRRRFLNDPYATIGRREVPMRDGTLLPVCRLCGFHFGSNLAIAPM